MNTITIRLYRDFSFINYILPGKLSDQLGDDRVEGRVMSAELFKKVTSRRQTIRRLKTKRINEMR